jgi:hypothetical protein
VSPFIVPLVLGSRPTLSHEKKWVGRVFECTFPYVCEMCQKAVPTFPNEFTPMLGQVLRSKVGINPSMCLGMGCPNYWALVDEKLQGA